MCAKTVEMYCWNDGSASIKWTISTISRDFSKDFVEKGDEDVEVIVC